MNKQSSSFPTRQISQLLAAGTSTVICAVLVTLVPGIPNAHARAARSSTAAKTPQSLTLKQAVGRALKGNPTMTAQRLKQRETRLRISSAKRDLFPKITLQGTGLVWDKALKLNLVSGSLPTPPDTCPLGCVSYLGQLLGGFSSITLRDQLTVTGSATVTQPVTATFALIQQLKVSKLEHRAAALQREQKERRLRAQVTKAYLQVLQAERRISIASDGHKLLQAHLKRVQAFRASDMVGANEVLKVQVALARAKQMLTLARAGRDLARANLRMIMGAPVGARFRLSERFADPPPRFRKTLMACQSTAEQNRAELKTLGLKRKMLVAGRKAKRIMLLPQAAVFAKLQLNHGMGSLQPSRSFYAGINLRWTFEWGARKKEADVYAVKTRRLDQLRKHYRRGVRLEVRKHYLTVRTAGKNLGVARKAVKLAAEGLRLETARFGQGVRTSTDLLDAQRRYDEARATYTTNLYSYYTGLAELRSAMGQGA